MGDSGCSTPSLSSSASPFSVLEQFPCISGLPVKGHGVWSSICLLPQNYCGVHRASSTQGLGLAGEGDTSTQQTDPGMGGLEAAGPGPVTFKKKGHEGDDGWGELGESQSIHPVVPRRVLRGENHGEREGSIAITSHRPPHSKCPMRSLGAELSFSSAPDLSMTGPTAGVCVWGGGHWFVSQLLF